MKKQAKTIFYLKTTPLVTEFASLYDISKKNTDIVKNS